MKKLALIGFLIPSLTFAAWWNPSSWIWVQRIFYPVSDQQIQIIDELSQKVSDLEKKLEEDSKGEDKKVTNPAVSKSAVTEPKIVNGGSSGVSLTASEIFQLVSYGIVYIEVGNGHGSGFVISNDGLILTNAHVVGKYKIVTLYFGNKSVQADVIGRDDFTDVALLKAVALPSSAKVLNLGDTSNLMQGDRVYTLGFPQNTNKEVSIKEGIFSRKSSIGSNPTLEVTAGIFFGNSGGPLVDTKGNAVGINSWGEASKDNRGDTVGELGHALDINKVKQLLPELKKGLVLERNKISSESEFLIKGILQKLQTKIGNKEITEYLLTDIGDDMYFSRYLSGSLNVLNSLRQTILSIDEDISTKFLETDTTLSNYQRGKISEFHFFIRNKIGEYDRKLVYITELSTNLNSNKATNQDLNMKTSITELKKYIQTEVNTINEKLWIASIF